MKVINLFKGRCQITFRYDIWTYFTSYNFSCIAFNLSVRLWVAGWLFSKTRYFCFVGSRKVNTTHRYPTWKALCETRRSAGQPPTGPRRGFITVSGISLRFTSVRPSFLCHHVNVCVRGNSRVTVRGCESRWTFHDSLICGWLFL